MARDKRHIVEAQDGQIQIITCNSDDDDPRHDLHVQKALFELSRDGTDMQTHFDPVVHTVEALAVGIPGHTPITQIELDVSVIPVNRAQRVLWRVVNGFVVPVQS